MSDKKKAKTVAHATMVWEREQLKAAMMVEQIDKALAIIEENKGELTEAEIADVEKHVADRKKDIEDFLLSAKQKYIKKLAEFGIEPTLPVEKPNA